MDKRFGPADWLIVSGGLLLLVASRLAWWTVTWAGAPATSTDAFEYTLTGVVPLVVLLVVSVLLVIVKTDSLPLRAWIVHPLLVAVAIMGVASLVGIRFFWSGFSGAAGVSRGIGLYLAGAAVVLALLGAGAGLRVLGRSPSEVAAPDRVDEDFDELDDPDDVLDTTYGEPAEKEDDLVRRFNTVPPVAPHGRTGRTGRAVAPPRREPTRREATPRRRIERTVTPPPPSRRRPSGPPLP